MSIDFLIINIKGFTMVQNFVVIIIVLVIGCNGKRASTNASPPPPKTAVVDTAIADKSTTNELEKIKTRNEKLQTQIISQNETLKKVQDTLAKELEADKTTTVDVGAKDTPCDIVTEADKTFLVCNGTKIQITSQKDLDILKKTLNTQTATATVNSTATTAATTNKCKVFSYKHHPKLKVADCDGTLDGVGDIVILGDNGNDRSFLGNCITYDKLTALDKRIVSYFLSLAGTQDCHTAEKKFNSMQILNMSSKEIYDLRIIRGFAVLDDLILDNNDIKYVGTLLEFSSTLTKLSLTDNELNDISNLKHLTKLRFLNIENNYISDISPLHNLNLEYFAYKNNYIDMKSQQNCPFNQTKGALKKACDDYVNNTISSSSNNNINNNNNNTVSNTINPSSIYRAIDYSITQDVSYWKIKVYNMGNVTMTCDSVKIISDNFTMTHPITNQSIILDEALKSIFYEPITSKVTKISAHCDGVWLDVDVGAITPKPVIHVIDSNNKCTAMYETQAAVLKQALENMITGTGPCP
jgi:hypothetical protein